VGVDSVNVKPGADVNTDQSSANNSASGVDMADNSSKSQKTKSRDEKDDADIPDRIKKIIQRKKSGRIKRETSIGTKQTDTKKSNINRSDITIGQTSSVSGKLEDT
jgi:hypothetical protein